MTDYAGGGEAQVPQIDCPFCDEKISSRAKKCRHCGETVDVAMRKAEEALRAAGSTPQVFMNAGGGAAAAATGNGNGQLRPFGHGIHIFLSIISLGWWILVWIPMYIFRNKSIYF